MATIWGRMEQMFGSAPSKETPAASPRFTATIQNLLGGPMAFREIGTPQSESPAPGIGTFAQQKNLTPRAGGPATSVVPGITPPRLKQEPVVWRRGLGASCSSTSVLRSASTTNGSSKTIGLHPSTSVSGLSRTPPVLSVPPPLFARSGVGQSGDEERRYCVESVAEAGKNHDKRAEELVHNGVVYGTAETTKRGQQQRSVTPRPLQQGSGNNGPHLFYPEQLQPVMVVGINDFSGSAAGPGHLRRLPEPRAAVPSPESKVPVSHSRGTILDKVMGGSAAPPGPPVAAAQHLVGFVPQSVRSQGEHSRVVVRDQGSISLDDNNLMGLREDGDHVTSLVSSSSLARDARALGLPKMLCRSDGHSSASDSGSSSVDSATPLSGVHVVGHSRSLLVQGRNLDVFVDTGAAHAPRQRERASSSGTSSKRSGGSHGGTTTSSRREPVAFRVERLVEDLADELADTDAEAAEKLRAAEEVEYVLQEGRTGEILHSESVKLLDATRPHQPSSWRVNVATGSGCDTAIGEGAIAMPEKLRDLFTRAKPRTESVVLTSSGGDEEHDRSLLSASVIDARHMERISSAGSAAGAEQVVVPPPDSQLIAGAVSEEDPPGFVFETLPHGVAATALAATRHENDRDRAGSPRRRQPGTKKRKPVSYRASPRKKIPGLSPKKVAFHGGYPIAASEGSASVEDDSCRSVSVSSDPVVQQGGSRAPGTTAVAGGQDVARSSSLQVERTVSCCDVPPGPAAARGSAANTVLAEAEQEEPQPSDTEPAAAMPTTDEGEERAKIAAGAHRQVCAARSSSSSKSSVPPAFGEGYRFAGGNLLLPTTCTLSTGREVTLSPEKGSPQVRCLVRDLTPNVDVSPKVVVLEHNNHEKRGEENLVRLEDTVEKDENAERGGACRRDVNRTFLASERLFAPPPTLPHCEHDDAGDVATLTIREPSGAPVSVPILELDDTPGSGASEVVQNARFGGAPLAEPSPMESLVSLDKIFDNPFKRRPAAALPEPNDGAPPQAEEEALDTKKNLVEILQDFDGRTAGMATAQAESLLLEPCTVKSDVVYPLVDAVAASPDVRLTEQVAGAVTSERLKVSRASEPREKSNTTSSPTGRRPRSALRTRSRSASKVQCSAASASSPASPLEIELHPQPGSKSSPVFEAGPGPPPGAARVTGTVKNVDDFAQPPDMDAAGDSDGEQGENSDEIDGRAEKRSSFKPAPRGRAARRIRLEKSKRKPALDSGVSILRGSAGKIVIKKEKSPATTRSCGWGEPENPFENMVDPDGMIASDPLYPGQQPLTSPSDGSFVYDSSVQESVHGTPVEVERGPLQTLSVADFVAEDSLQMDASLAEQYSSGAGEVTTRPPPAVVYEIAAADVTPLSRMAAADVVDRGDADGAKRLLSTGHHDLPRFGLMSSSSSGLSSPAANGQGNEFTFLHSTASPAGEPNSVSEDVPRHRPLVPSAAQLSDPCVFTDAGPYSPEAMEPRPACAQGEQAVSVLEKRPETPKTVSRAAAEDKERSVSSPAASPPRGDEPSPEIIVARGPAFQSYDAPRRVRDGTTAESTGGDVVEAPSSSAILDDFIVVKKATPVELRQRSSQPPSRKSSHDFSTESANHVNIMGKGAGDDHATSAMSLQAAFAKKFSGHFERSRVRAEARAARRLERKEAEKREEARRAEEARSAKTVATKQLAARKACSPGSVSEERSYASSASAAAYSMERTAKGLHHGGSSVPREMDSSSTASIPHYQRPRMPSSKRMRKGAAANATSSSARDLHGRRNSSTSVSRRGLSRGVEKSGESSTKRPAETEAAQQTRKAAKNRYNFFEGLVSASPSDADPHGSTVDDEPPLQRAFRLRAEKREQADEGIIVDEETPGHSTTPGGRSAPDRVAVAEAASRREGRKGKAPFSRGSGKPPPASSSSRAAAQARGVAVSRQAGTPKAAARGAKNDSAPQTPIVPAEAGGVSSKTSGTRDRGGVTFSEREFFAALKDSPMLQSLKGGVELDSCLLCNSTGVEMGLHFCTGCEKKMYHDIKANFVEEMHT
eukprot:CAMPEP_0178986616 /NCGR_PEP_ID=MMETSP0795-20121207/2801_1 /TAXON_ID=88552 /ORGANISM="Amoebophrya sp., Strain Ameob2" /LENGTH=2028 /DNA_ID=CAMNT_0020677693 /DNA_START=158 /DNA_END=6241 /DNA_ORIENTATION=-